MNRLERMSPEEVGEIYRARFKTNDLPSVTVNQWQGMSRSPYTHCSICPKPPAEHCPDNCDNVRKAQQGVDGVSITISP